MSSTIPDTPDEPTIDKPVLTLSVTALAAGALAAVTSAVIGSHLGTAGTLTGAALGSVIGAFSTALYTFGLQRTWHALGALTPRRANLVAGVLLTALVAFVVALGAITGLEKATGTSLAGEPGTTVERVRVVTVERPAAAGAEVADEAAPAASESATQDPVTADPMLATPSPAEPQPGASAEPTPSETPAPTEPTTPTDSPTAGTPVPSTPSAPAEPGTGA